MDRVRNIGSAAVLASLTGGPLLITMSVIDTLLSGRPVVVDPDQVTQITAVIGKLIVAGWFVAIVPNLIGTIALGWLGRFNIGMRIPAFWGIVGAAMAGVPAWATRGPLDTWKTPTALAGIGAVSALLCRARVRWDDDSDGVPPSRIDLTPVHPPATP